MSGHRFLDLIAARAPIVQAPMAGAGGVDLAVAAIDGGAIGSLPGALLTPEQLVAQAAEMRARTDGPLNLNFFCHTMPPMPDEGAWRALLTPFYAAEGVAEPATPPPLRRPFGAAMCAAVESVRPDIVSFHFGLPDPALLARIRASRAVVIGNATTVDEARWLGAHGCDAIIAQGAEAGGHAGWFRDRHRPRWLPSLLRAILAETDLPVIAAGGIMDGADAAAALRAGAAAVQVGTAYLACPEARIAAPHRALLGTPQADDTAFTTLFSGREARGIRNLLMRELGTQHPAAPPFPHASTLLAPLRAAAEADGRGDYSPLWAGTGASRARPMGARELTQAITREIAVHLATAQEN